MKLLQKTIRNYFIYSGILLLVAIPVFYFVIQSIVTEDVDEDLIATKEALKPKISDALLHNTIDQLKFLDHDITISISPFTEEEDSLTTEKIYDSIAKEEVPHRVLTSHFHVNGKPCMLRIKTSLVDNEDVIQSVVKVQSILLLLLFAGLLIINRGLSKGIWKPFYSTLDKLRNYKVEQQEVLMLSKSSVNEFNDLNQSLEELTQRARKTYISQKEFTENASHEMQTPLAVFQNKLELLMQTSPINAEQAELMSDLSNAGQRLTRLNRSLVLLTRIENNQFIEKESVLLNHVIEMHLRQYQSHITDKNIILILDVQSQVVLTANKALLEILVRNLLANSIRHNYNGGIVKITLQSDKLIIKNSGKGPSLNRQKLFKRFQKESSDSNSIGLGLAIASRICEINGFTISYNHAEHLHDFTVSFQDI